MTIDPAPVNQPGSLVPGSLDALGWDAAWAETFAPFAADGLRPATGRGGPSRDFDRA